MTPWSAGAAPGDSDTTFVPITACRLADTRPAPNRVGSQSNFGIADTKTFQVTGSNGECVGLPTEAAAVSMNITALGATQQSFLTFWGSGDRPLAASLNPSPDTPPTPNAVTTELSSTGAFDVYNDAGRVDLVIDVNGYYLKSSLASLQDQIDELASLRSDVDTLLAQEPFVTTATSNAPSTVSGLLDTITASLTATAPTPGSFTVWSDATVFDSGNGGLTGCSLTTGTTADSGVERGYQSTSDSPLGSITSVRSFEVDAGQDFTVNHVCRRLTPGSSSSSQTRLTAIFTPES